MWIQAIEQNAGRGRSGREWVSPPGNLYATLLMPVQDDPAGSALYSFVACLAIGDTLGVLAGRSAQISMKWPNDALLSERKVAGVLLETGVVDDERWLSIGIGINLAHAPTETRWPAISVMEATGQLAPDPDAVMTVLAAAMRVRGGQLERKGFASIRTDWLNKAARIGETVEVRLPAETVTGVFETLDDDGAMLLQTGTGPRRIHAGDVHFPGGPDAAGH